MFSGQAVAVTRAARRVPKAHSVLLFAIGLRAEGTTVWRTGKADGPEDTHDEQQTTEHGSPPVHGGGTVRLRGQSQARVRRGVPGSCGRLQVSRSVKLLRPLGMSASHAAVELAHAPGRIDPLGPCPPDNIREDNHQEADRNKCDQGVLLRYLGGIVSIHRQGQASANRVRVAG
jgi:hypothetical protein